jgi:hypothetical protein
MHRKEKRLRDVDSAELAQRLRVFIWLGSSAFVLLSLVEFILLGNSPKFYLFLFLNIPFLILVGLLMIWIIDHSARGWVGMVSGAGNLQPTPSFSLQESLIIRGRYPEAAESFRAHLVVHPEDNDARLALARLCSMHLDDVAGAERLYQEIRRTQPTSRQEAMASNQLIDLYRATGSKGRLKTELARYAERYQGTRAGVEAKRMLLDLKEEDLKGE